MTGWPTTWSASSRPSAGWVARLTTRDWEIRLAWERQLAAARWLNVGLAGGVRRPGWDRPPGAVVSHRARQRRGALLGRRPGPRPVRTHALRVRRRGAEEAISARHHCLRGDVGAGLQRARRRLRPGRTEDQGRARRQRVGDHRPEDLDHVRSPRRLAVRAVPHQPDARRSTRASRCCSCPATRPAWKSAPSATSPAAPSSAKCSSTGPAPKRTTSSARSTAAGGSSWARLATSERARPCCRFRPCSAER